MLKIYKRKKAAAIPTTPIKLDTTLPPSFFRSPPRDPQMEALGKKVMEDARRDRGRERENGKLWSRSNYRWSFKK